MRFFRRQAAQPTQGPAAAEIVKPDLDPIAVFRADGVVEGLIARQERRLSEALNAGDPLVVQVADASGESQNWIQFDLDDVVAVAAPPKPASPRRVARRRHLIEVDAHPFAISGTAHMPPGADPIRYANSAPQRWLALTSCHVATDDHEWEVDVVLVNLDHAVRALPRKSEA